VLPSGAILGMTRQEIKRKFDEIVDSSGVEKLRTYAPPVRQPARRPERQFHAISA